MNKKIFLLVISLLVIITGCDNEETKKEIDAPKGEIKEEAKIKIIDINSNTRPYAVVINNYPGAVKAHSGLNDAHIVYEFPIEGGISRSLAIYKDKTDVKIGTVRSARHDYLDYVLENDAIFVHFGWSHTAAQDISKLGINYIDGNTSDPSIFWRENPIGLATEHTVYTNMSKIVNYDKGYRKTTDVKPPLNYVTTDVNLEFHEDAIQANSVEIQYSGSYRIKFKYNFEKQRYDRYVNDEEHFDYFNKEQYDTKNIVVVLLDWGYVSDHADAAGNNYLDLYNVGTGKGYYITNGYAKRITWSKSDRSSQTVYKYLDGTEVEINDGNTYVMFQSNNQGVAIK